MIYFIVLFICWAFIAFFLQLGVWYFWLFPLIFLVVFFSQGIKDVHLKLLETDLSEKYGLYLLIGFIFLWIFGVLNFIGLDYQSGFFVLLFLTLLARYGAYFLNYEDGKQLFEHFFLIFLLLLLWNSVFLDGVIGISAMLSLTSLFAVLAYGGLRYWVASFFPVDSKYQYYFFFFLFLAFLRALFVSVNGGLQALNLDLGICFVLLLCLDYSKSSPQKNLEASRKVSLRRVLAGERILGKKNRLTLMHSGILFFKELPMKLWNFLEYLNVVLLLGVLVAYLFPVFQGQVLQQWWYRLGIAFFLANAFLLKKNQIFSLLSRFAVVVIINFSLYVSLLVVDKNIQSMLPWLIVWNLLCGVLVFYTRFGMVRKYVKKIDVLFWLIASLVAMLLNIVLLMWLSISWQLIFSLIFFYLGIQWVITYYVIQLIKVYDLPKTEEGSTSSDPLEKLLEKEISL